MMRATFVHVYQCLYPVSRSGRGNYNYRVDSNDCTAALLFLAGVFTWVRTVMYGTCTSVVLLVLIAPNDGSASEPLT